MNSLRPKILMGVILFCYTPFGRDPMSGAVGAVDISVLNADVMTTWWRALASQTFSPLSRLPVKRVASNSRLRTALFVD